MYDKCMMYNLYICMYDGIYIYMYICDVYSEFNELQLLIARTRCFSHMFFAPVQFLGLLLVEAHDFG